MRKKPNYWTFDRCFEDSSKCKSFREWRRRFPLSYNKAKWRSSQWFGKLTEHFDKPPAWTKEQCLVSLKKSSSLSRWKKNNWPMAKYAENKGWIPYLLKESGIEIIRPWTKDRIRSEIKNFKTLNEWREKSPRSYMSARKKGLICKFGLKKEPGPTKKEIYADCLKYKQLKEWEKSSSKTYKAAIKLGIIAKCKKIMGIKDCIPASYWSFNRCKAEALKYKTRTQWQKGSHGSYRASVKHKWIEKVTKHMLTMGEIIRINKTKWTKKECLMSAKDYDQISHWQKKCPGAYRAALNNGWSKECTSHMRVILGYWNKKRCLKDAKKYSRKGKWHKESAGAFRAALNNGWFKECTAHMRQWRTKEDCLKDALRFKSKEEWFLQSPGFYWSAYSKGYFKYCTRHMPERSVGELREKRSVDKLIKFINKKFKNKVKVEREIMLDKKSFPDLILTIGNKKVILEVKHDYSRWKNTQLNEQIEKYSTSGRKKYKNDLVGCYICSPFGKYGESFQDVLKLVENLL